MSRKKWEPVSEADAAKEQQDGGIHDGRQDIVRALFPLVLVTGTALAQDDRFPVPRIHDRLPPGPERQLERPARRVGPSADAAGRDPRGSRGFQELH